jgi:hypothetical protein
VDCWGKSVTFEEATREAPHAADKALSKAIEPLRYGRKVDADDLTGILVGRVSAALDGEIGGLTWNCSILRHRRGHASEEKKYGADLLMHVTMDTPSQAYSKGVLVQAKKIGPYQNMLASEKRELNEQCRKCQQLLRQFLFFTTMMGMLGAALLQELLALAATIFTNFAVGLRTDFFLNISAVQSAIHEYLVRL